MHDVEEKSKSVCKRRADALKSGKAAQQQHAAAREKHAALVNEKAADLTKLKTELEALQKSIDPELFGEYKKLVADNKFPTTRRICIIAAVAD